MSLTRQDLHDADEYIARALCLSDNIYWDDQNEIGQDAYRRFAKTARHAMVRFLTLTQQPEIAVLLGKYKVGQAVAKITGYRGPGEVRGLFTMSDGRLLYNVEHRIEGGDLFVHNYQESNLAARDE